MRHTKGPWITICNDKITPLIKSGREEIARMSHTTFSSEQNDANAKLIAAAPEMLEALEELTEILRRFGGMPLSDPFKYDKLIKKARGEK